jgi:hypothetical protein
MAFRTTAVVSGTVAEAERDDIAATGTKIKRVNIFEDRMTQTARKQLYELTGEAT